MNAPQSLDTVLRVNGPDGSVERFPLQHGSEISIGRDPSCNISLEAPEVSRRHILLVADRSRVRITDMSANGTRIGDQLVHRDTALVSSDTEIGVGPFFLRCEALDVANGGRGTQDVSAAVRRAIHRRLLDNLDLVRLERDRMNRQMMASKVREALTAIVAVMTDQLPAGTDQAMLVAELADEALGLGPLEAMLADDSITEIMVVNPRLIYVERQGRLEPSGATFTDDESVRSVLERIVTPLGRRIDESSPLLDARLADGSRVNAVIPPLAVKGTCITIRKFPKRRWSVDDLLRFGTLTERMARFLQRCVAVRKNIIVSGGTGSGKTTLLNILSAYVDDAERVVTIEDSAELRLSQRHVVTLEARPPNMEGRGQVTIRDLVKNAMRMRPDRIIVGECRGGEALDVLQAMNTGHEGSMTTTHANSSFEALKRIETLALMAGVDLPSRAVREQVAASVDLVVQQLRLPDGSRKITQVAELTGLDDDGELQVQEIFGFRRMATEADGTVRGEFYATGYLPSFLNDFIVHGLVPPEGGDYV